MRNIKRMFLTAAAAAVGALVLAGPAAAQETAPNNPVKVDFSGNKKKGTLFIGLGPQQANPPFKTNNALVKLAGGLTVDTGFVPDCQPSQLEGLNPQAALAACGPPAGKKRNALVANGSAKAVIGSGADAVTLDAAAMAFAGPGNDVLVYTRVDAINVTQIITCTLGPGPDPFKSSFNCPVPPLAGGAGALSEFNLTFDRTEKKVKKKKNGKKKKKIKSVVKGTCIGGEYINEVTFNYDDAPPETNRYSDPC